MQMLLSQTPDPRKNRASPPLFFFFFFFSVISPLPVFFCLTRPAPAPQTDQRLSVSQD